MSDREVVKVGDDYYALVRRRRTRTGAYVFVSQTLFNAAKDRGLSGKQRRNARKAAQRAERLA